MFASVVREGDTLQSFCKTSLAPAKDLDLNPCTSILDYKWENLYTPSNRFLERFQPQIYTEFQQKPHQRLSLYLLSSVRGLSSLWRIHQPRAYSNKWPSNTFQNITLFRIGLADVLQKTASAQNWIKHGALFFIIQECKHHRDCLYVRIKLNKGLLGKEKKLQYTLVLIMTLL